VTCASIVARSFASVTKPSSRSRRRRRPRRPGSGSPRATFALVGLSRLRRGRGRRGGARDPDAPRPAGSRALQVRGAFGPEGDPQKRGPHLRHGPDQRPGLRGRGVARPLPRAGDPARGAALPQGPSRGGRARAQVWALPAPPLPLAKFAGWRSLVVLLCASYEPSHSARGSAKGTSTGAPSTVGLPLEPMVMVTGPMKGDQCPRCCDALRVIGH